MKKLYLIFLFSILTNALYSQCNPSFKTISNNISNFDAEKFEFWDKKFGWAGGSYKGHITSDSGKTWTTFILPDQGGAFVDLHMESTSIGYCTGLYNDPITFTTNGVIYKTTDGGSTWNVHYNHGEKVVLTSLHFVNSSVGYALDFNTNTYSSNILKTTDGGTTWNSVFTHSALEDGGTINGSPKIGHFISTTTGYVIGNNGTIFKTTNGGTTWSSQITGLAYVDDIYMINSTVAYIVDDTHIKMTSDGGTTWTSIYNSAYGIYNIQFLNANDGFAFCVGSNLLITKDGGSNWFVSTWCDKGLYNPGFTAGFIHSDKEGIILNMKGGQSMLKYKCHTPVLSNEIVGNAQTSNAIENYQFTISPSEYWFMDAVWTVPNGGIILADSAGTQNYVSGNNVIDTRRERYLTVQWNSDGSHSINISFPNECGTANKTLNVQNSIATGIANSENSHVFKIYPNPAKDILIIDGEFNGIKIFNSYGEEIKVNANGNEVNVADLITGMYLIRVFKSGNQIGTSKFLKQ